MERLTAIGLFLFLAIPIPLRAADSSGPVPQDLLSYDLTVRVEPAAGSIAVEGSIEVPLNDPAAPNFKFNLHETFAIKQLLVNGEPAKYADAPVESEFPLPASRGVVVSLPAGLSQRRIRMDIEYGGRMKALPEFNATPDWRHALDDQVNSRMVELASYSSWYPQFVFGQPVRVKLGLSLPHGWTSICSGKEVENHVADGRALTRWSSPRDTDIVILASPNYKERSFQESNVNVEIYYTQMPERFIEQEGTQIADVLKLYTARLGETTIPGGTVKHAYSPKRKGQGKAGFARPGLIVTSEGLTLEALARDPKFSLFQGIAHEIAHYWWNFGAGQGDWINEAFAEYFSAVAVQQLQSEEKFRGIMANSRKQVMELPADAPSLSAVPPMQQTSFVVRYYKGALMLDTLRQSMGDEKFFLASREFFQTYTGKPTGTTEFRSFWKAKLGSQGDLIDVWLDSRGGLPGSSEKRREVSRAWEMMERGPRWERRKDPPFDFAQGRLRANRSPDGAPARRFFEDAGTRSGPPAAQALVGDIARQERGRSCKSRRAGRVYSVGQSVPPCWFCHGERGAQCPPRLSRELCAVCSHRCSCSLPRRCGALTEAKTKRS